MYCSDYHTHSQLSPDSSAPLEQMAQAAVEAGLDELCVTDHCDLLTLQGEPVERYDWPPAVAQYQAAAAQFSSGLTLKLGLELGMGHLNPAAGGTLRQQVFAFEREVILQAVEREGSLRKAAKALGVDHSTLVKKYRHFQQDDSGPDGR